MPENAEAMAKALKFLSRSERFEGEVRTHLNGFDPEVVEDTIASLKTRNLLNEKRALDSYLRTHSGRKAVGAYRMAQELRQKGAPESILSTLTEFSEDDSALQALAGKFRQGADLNKAYRFLLSRGFSYEVATKATRNFFNPDVD